MVCQWIKGQWHQDEGQTPTASDHFEVTGKVTGIQNFLPELHGYAQPTDFLSVLNQTRQSQAPEWTSGQGQGPSGTQFPVAPPPPLALVTHSQMGNAQQAIPHNFSKPQARAVQWMDPPAQPPIASSSGLNRSSGQSQPLPQSSFQVGTPHTNHPPPTSNDNVMWAMVNALKQQTD